MYFHCFLFCLSRADICCYKFNWHFECILLYWHALEVYPRCQKQCPTFNYHSKTFVLFICTQQLKITHIHLTVMVVYIYLLQAFKVQMMVTGGLWRCQSKLKWDSCWGSWDWAIPVKNVIWKWKQANLFTGNDWGLNIHGESGEY